MNENPTTWEEAVGLVMDNRYPFGFTTPAPLDLADDLIEVDDPPEWLYEYVADRALRGLLNTRFPDQVVTDYTIGAIKQELQDLFVSKQRDYGHGNILRYGIQGIEVRLSDKLQRLANLAKNGTDPANESVIDSWSDVVGYCVLALMVLKGWFELPLEADLVQQAPPVDPLAVPRDSSMDEKWCHQAAPNGFICCRADGHPGDHMAYGMDNSRAISRWPQASDPLTGPRHDPVCAASNRTPTTAGTHIFPDGWKPKPFSTEPYPAWWGETDNGWDIWLQKYSIPHCSCFLCSGQAWR